MPASLGTIDNILKEVYETKIQDQLQNEITAIKRIEQTSDGVTETTGGKYVDFPVHVRRNHGIGYRPEQGQLPAAGQQGYAEVHVPLKYGYGRFRITGQAMKLSNSNEKAFAKALDEEMNRLKDDLAKDSARIAYGDGSGVVTRINDNATSATHDVTSTQYLDEGMIVDVLTESNGAVTESNITITDVDPEASEVTFSESFTGATTLAVYRQGNRNNEPTGLDLIVNDTGILHTLDPSVERKWKAIVMDNGGTPRALSEGLMIEACDRVRINGGKISVIFTSLGVRRAYFNLLTQQRQFVNTKEFAGGFTGLPFNYGKEIPVVEDVDAPPSVMWGLDEAQLKVYRTQDWHYADDDGGTMKWVYDYDVWEGFMRKYWEMGTHRRNTSFKIEDIIEG